MKTYPSIQYYKDNMFGEHVYAFDKLDGSNIRSVWNLKASKKSTNNGFTRFGTRRQLIDNKDEVWSNAIDLFMNKYSNDLDKIFREDNYFKNAVNMTVFFEYCGPNSFAGRHTDSKDNMDVVLFDVDQYKKGIMIPNLFVEKFGHLDIPNIVYEGDFDESLIENVRNNVYNLKEGVVVKGSRKTKNSELVFMMKIKTFEWLNKVKSEYGQEVLKNELNGDLSYYK